MMESVDYLRTPISRFHRRAECYRKQLENLPMSQSDEPRPEAKARRRHHKIGVGSIVDSNAQV
jgi:hypothetical protein